MPVTAKLSRKFYERLGDEIANELVEWFNSVDTSYRTELREFNELNFARFDAKVEQRFAESDAKLERRFAEADAKVDARLTAFESRVDARLSKMDLRFSEFEARFTASEARTLKWMFSLWTGSMLTLAGFMMAILRAVKG